MESKKCTDCKIFKSLDNFRVSKSKCKKCYYKTYYINNREKIIEYQLDRYNNNKGDLIEYQLDRYNNNREELIEYQKKYSKDNRDSINRRVNNKMKKDPLFKIRMYMSSSIRQSLKDKEIGKKTKTQDILGCSFYDVKEYLESKFEPWMNWQNHGKYNGEFNYGWDIDHIIPLSSAKNEEDLLKLFHYSNLQPLCGYINRHIKRDNITY